MSTSCFVVYVGNSICARHQFDALLDMPMQEVLELLPIASDMNEALLHRTGKIGDILACALEHENGNLPAGPDAEPVIEVYLEAIQWAAECARNLF